MEKLILNITGFEEYTEPPTFRVHKPVGNFISEHIPQFSDSKRNCKVYYLKDKKELKVYSYCSAPQCDVFLHYTMGKNRNSRDRHFGMSCNNLPEFSVNIFYTCRKVFAFCRIFYSHNSLSQESLFKIVIKKTLMTPL